MAILGPVTRDALRRFERNDLVEAIDVRHDRVRVSYSTGLRETWGLLGERQRRITLPMASWWKHEPLAAPEWRSFDQLAENYVAADDALFVVTGRDVNRSGFLDRRLLVHRVVRCLVEEHWIKPAYPQQALADDLARLRADPRCFAITKGLLRGQPGRTTAPPPGFVLANHVVDWGPLAGPGRPALRDAWSDPRRLHLAVNKLVEQGQDITRASVIHRMTVGKAEGFPQKAGPRWESPSLCRSIMSDLLGLGHRPLVLDLDPGCGAKAVATLSFKGILLVPSMSMVSPEGIAWARDVGGEVVEDDGLMTADAIFVGVQDIQGLVAHVETVGRRCACVVAELPSGDGVREALPGIDLVRFRPRPFQSDRVLAIWKQR